MSEKRVGDRLFSFYKESKFLRYKQFHLERDILRVGFALFEAEKRLKKTGTIGPVSILLSRRTFRRIDVEELKGILTDLFLLILLEDIRIEVEEINDLRGRVRKRAEFPQKEAIILFSGGVDSYCGVKIAEELYQDLLGLFVAHNDQGRIIRIVEDMRPLLSTKIAKLIAPGMGTLGYSQLRGFLYILSAGAYMNLCRASTILVTECGPTMYQPLFSPYDSITYTTHPYVLEAARDVLEILLGFEPKIVIPFENLTKAEIISNSGIRDFSSTHSCITQRFGDHDGTCFGCVTRKLACLASGVRDVAYNKDVFGPDANQDNLRNTLEFSRDLLDCYHDMPPFQREKIDEFGKQDLFRRYALDNLAGLMLGVASQDPLCGLFTGREKVLQERVSQVRRAPMAPDFSNSVR